MRKLLYFLIGFCIPFIAIRAFANTCEYNTKSIDQWALSTAHYSYEYLGTYTKQIDAILAMTSGGQYASNSSMCFTISANEDSSVKMSFCYGFADNDGNGQFQNQYDDIGPRVYTVYSTTGDACAFDPDSDGDGLPDDCDMYPNDSTPYSVKLTQYQTTDGSRSGSRTYEEYETDRGDTRFIGGWDSSYKTWFVYEPTWIDGADLCGSIGDNVLTDGSDSDLSPENPLGDTPISVGGDGSAESTPDAGSSSGVAADGTESDADQKIIGNTKATADNTQILTAYMKDLNKKVSEHNALVASGQLTEQENREADQREAEQAEDNFNSVSVDDHFSGVSGNLTEGEDYDLPGELSEETFINDFFSSNPLITAFENSAFESSNSTPKATLVLAELGTHEIDLSPLEDGFKLAGDLLFALCSIGALILVVRG